MHIIPHGTKETHFLTSSHHTLSCCIWKSKPVYRYVFLITAGQLPYEAAAEGQKELEFFYFTFVYFHPFESKRQQEEDRDVLSPTFPRFNFMILLSLPGKTGGNVLNEQGVLWKFKQPS